LRKAGERLAAYAPMRSRIEAGFRSSDGHQVNGPATVADAILALSDLDRPPGRLVIGEGALDRAEAALETRRNLYPAELGVHATTDG
jgi:hypothetical protein